MYLVWIQEGAEIRLETRSNWITTWFNWATWLWPESLSKHSGCKSIIDNLLQVSLNINDLPEEIVIRILSFLTLPELLDSALVCKFWKELTTVPQLRQLVNESRLEGIVTTRRVERLLSSRYVQRINLDQCHYIDESVLHKIPGEARLQYLSLEG